MSFLGEIKRRKVFQVAAVYAVVAWLLVQVITSISEPLSLPDWADTLVIVLLAVGFPIAVILAWAFDLTPQGIKSDLEIQSSGTPAQVGGQRLNHLLQGLVLVAVGFLVVDQYLLEPRASSPAVSSVSNAADPQPVNRFVHLVPFDQQFRWTEELLMALSPDGRHFIFNTTQGLYLRAMGDLEARLIPGTEEEVRYPFFSPDSQSVAYYFDNQIMRIAISGGLPVVIMDDVSRVYGASWGADDTILFGQLEGIFRVSANSGPSELIIPSDGSTQFYGPQLLPDGDSVLFSVGVRADWDAGQIVVQSLSTGERTVLVEGGSDARYLSTGHIVYALGDTLFAVAFDPDTLMVSGGAVPLVQGVMRASGYATGAANYGVSEDGTLAYIAGGSADVRTLVWVDREGNEDPIPALPSSRYRYPRISPDPRGTRVALDDNNENNDLLVLNLVNGTRSYLTLGDSPVWTPDGARIAYHPGTGNFIDWISANGNGSPDRLATDPSTAGDSAHPYFFTPSGAELVFDGRANPGDDRDIGMIAISGDDEPVWLVQGPDDERNAELSPDGHWMAYQSDESGQWEIYVRPFPNADENEWPVSNVGGIKPLWSRDGSELYYLEPGPPSRLMSVSVNATDTDFSFLDRTQIIPWPYRGVDNPYRTYDVSPDGKRFLAIKEGGTEGATAQIIIVENWFEELKRLAPPAE